MKTMMILPAALALSACGAAETGAAASDAPEGVEISLAAPETEEGVCRPEHVSRAPVAESGLAAVRGEAVYADASGGGETNIPLQLVYRGYDDAGVGSENGVVILNTETACADLDITLTVKLCEYAPLGETPREGSCPEISLTGEDGFHSVTLVREDD